MSAPQAPYAQPPQDKPMSKLITGAIWIAIGSLIAAAIVCVVWVLVGDQNGLVGKAFTTVLLLAAFAGVVLLDANLAPRRPDWFALASMVSWVIALLVGAVKIWLDVTPSWAGDDYRYLEYGASGVERFFQLLFVIVVLQLALLHLRLFWRAAERHVTAFTRGVAIATTAFVVALALLLVFFLTFPDSFDYADLYWRIVVALAILAAVGTTLLPLLNALFAPKKPRERPITAAPQVHAGGYAAPAPQGWPTYYDGVTPLPVLPDGSPDWNAYYTGYPTAQPPLPPRPPLPPVPPVV
ncbi:hypothetical protein [Microbacterium gilvum]|uniref:Uncharacterized protein n=1 Tax=Microbacterium gilvum TaxID=1336204 RepID=A0ABP9AGB7_9MICO